MALKTLNALQVFPQSQERGKRGEEWSFAGWASNSR